MIKKYWEFINESLSELLLESDVTFSNNFRNVLSKINHPVAKSIIEIENKDYPVTANYFDIELSKNDTISFTPDRKAQEILGDDTREMVQFHGDGGWLRHTDSNNKMFDKLGYTYEPGKDPYHPNLNDVGEVIKKEVSDVSGNTYVWVKFTRDGNYVGEGVYNATRLTEINDKKTKIWSSNRQEIKVGRAMRALLRFAKINFKPAEIEEFVNLYKSTIDRLNDKFSYFEVVRGDDIAYWYNYRNYYTREGTLGSSCMSDVPNKWLDIYSKNPGKIGLVILKSENDQNKITGRALLWNLNDGKIFMDRIYTIKDSDVELFREYSKEQGWYYKFYNSSTENGDVVDSNGDKTSIDMVVSLDYTNMDKFPYLDTMKYFYYSKGKISNMNSLGGNYYYLEDTGGGNGVDDGCEYCGGSGYVTCGECEGNGKVECSNCSGSGYVDCDGCNNGRMDCGKCDGEGEITCPECYGNDEECEECGGSGKISCPECSGDGDIACDECNGKGEITCGECDGDGDYRCPECDGRGEVECPECY